MAIEMVNDGHTRSEVAKELGVSLRTVKKWIENGIQRKKGAGRKKINMGLEEQLFDWCVVKSIE
jgi:transposase